MHPQDSLISNQVGVSVAVVYLIQLLKNSSWFPWISQHTDQLNRWISVVAAFATSVGFQFAFTGSAATGGTLIIQVPALTVVLSVLLHSLGQVGIQESFYRTAVKPSSDVTLVAGLSNLEPVQVQPQDSHGASSAGGSV
jgi:hypothetical protein